MKVFYSFVMVYIFGGLTLSAATKNIKIDHCLQAIKSNILIDEFFDPEIQEWQDRKGKNLLHYAVLLKRPCIVACLLAAGFSTQVIDDDQNLPLHLELLHVQGNVESTVSCAILEKIDPLIMQKFIKIVKKINPRYIYCITGHNIIENSGDIVRILMQKTDLLYFNFLNDDEESPLSLLNKLLKKKDNFLLHQQYVNYALGCLSDKILKKILRDAFKYKYSYLRDRIIEIFMRKKKKVIF